MTEMNLDDLIESIERGPYITYKDRILLFRLLLIKRWFGIKKIKATGCGNSRWQVNHSGSGFTSSISRRDENVKD